MGGSTPVQMGCEAMLELPDSYFKEVQEKYKRRRDIFTSALKDCGFQLTAPQSAYYAFCRYDNVPALKGLASMDACFYMLKTVGVACVNGDNFYDDDGPKEQYLRF